MTSRLTNLIRSRSQPLRPQPTGIACALKKLNGIRAVLFDVYGTLLISASGDIGLDSGEHRSHAIAEVTEQFGLQLNCGPSAAVSMLETCIQQEHQVAKQSGVGYPEIEIREVWARVLDRIVEGDTSTIDFATFALEFELRVNPTWPMPNASELLMKLRNTGTVMGIVSNAQFFTPLLFPALLDQSLDDLGFASNLSYYSFDHKRAKPGLYLYEMAKRQLSELGISASSVLYVGNDMLNDVAPAAGVGFRTALFAGDKRSLRLRNDDDRVHGVEADIVVTELPQLIECLPIHN